MKPFETAGFLISPRGLGGFHSTYTTNHEVYITVNVWGPKSQVKLP